MSSSLRPLLSSEYIPFGSQYYRAPSPRPGEWERDLKQFAACGFNTVKFWIQWRWNQPEERRYDFSDIDSLMDIAHRNGLRVMLNTIVDVAPAWIYRKYPDASMITLDGRAVGPQTQPHRQIGGLGVCFNNREVMSQLFAFLKTAVKRYAGHPALEMWNVASEPELTSSMAELRLYAENADGMGDMLCYCVHCRRKFRQWLKTKYASIEKLNQSWNRNYRSFSEVEIPKTRNTFNDLIDWRMFFVHTLGEHVKRRFDVARKEDAGRHPLMCHHVFIQGFPVTSTASDPWNVGRFGDLHGFTQMDDPMMTDVLRSCAKDKPVISAEMLMLYGYTLDLPVPIDMNDIKRFIFTGVAANQKGFIFWQYRPELLGREAPAWGLTTLDGASTPWLKSFSEVNTVLQRNASFLLDAEPPQADVAMLYNPENQVFAWAATGNEKTATDSLLGTHRALYERNFRIDLVHPGELLQGILQRYKMLYIPFPYFMRKECCDAIARWVHAGGVLVTEANTAGWNPEEGEHSSVIPGQGLHTVFGARQGIAAPVVPGTFAEIQADGGRTLHGMLVKETLIPEGADVLARFASGEPAVTRNRWGKGEAILIGSYLGVPVHRNQSASNAAFLADFAEQALPGSRPAVEGGTKVRVDILAAGTQRMVILRNLEPVRVEARITLPGEGDASLIEQFSSARLEQRAGRFSVRLEPREVQIYRA